VSAAAVPAAFSGEIAEFALAGSGGGGYRSRPMKREDEVRIEREKAWIGDAVLALFARSWVLEERGRMDGEWFTRLTSNEFLSTFGPPTEVEARIGAIYREEGLAAAFAWMETELLPKFRRLMAKRGG
jgi:dsRNA-specific ribonuclease